MKIITLLAQKGGTGKTTLSIHLAVVAAATGKKSVIVDIDPQKSARFWKSRRAHTTPHVVKAVENDLPEKLAGLASDGFDLAVIDTAPHSRKESTLAAGLADLVLIPSRPAILDLEAIGASVAIVKETRTRGAIVLNACPFPGKNGEKAIVTEARDALGTYGLEVSPVAVSSRVAFSHSLIDGRAVTEFDRNGKAAAEIQSLFNWMTPILWEKP